MAPPSEFDDRLRARGSRCSVNENFLADGANRSGASLRRSGKFARLCGTPRIVPPTVYVFVDSEFPAECLRAASDRAQNSLNVGR